MVFLTKRFLWIKMFFLEWKSLFLDWVEQKHSIFHEKCFHDLSLSDLFQISSISNKFQRKFSLSTDSLSSSLMSDSSLINSQRYDFQTKSFLKAFSGHFFLLPTNFACLNKFHNILWLNWYYDSLNAEL